MTDIPLATILRINAARTIPIARYEEEGNFDRFGYIKDLAENHGADLPAVIEIADLLGPDEDFDGLVTTIEDAAEGFGFGALIIGAALMEQLGFDQLLDQQARKEFHDGLRDDPVPFTPDNCAATFGNIWTNRRDLYLRGIANVFAKLDRRFRSHNGFKIGARLIIDRALNEWGSWDRYERRDTLRPTFPK